MHEGFWPGLAGVLVCISLIIVAMVFKARAAAKAATKGTISQAKNAPRRNLRFSVNDAEVDRLLAKFPGPVTLKPSRAKWWLMLFLSTGMTAATIFVGVLALVGVQAGQKGAGMGVAFSVFGICFFGLGIPLSVMVLLRGALQLDREGFQVTLLGRKRYLWSEVADFRAYHGRRASGVEFNAARPRWRYAGKINAWLGRGNDMLADTFGLAAEQLAQLMEAWQSAALIRQVDNPEQPFSPAAPMQEIIPAEGSPSDRQESSEA